ncbi:hypothetical protein CXB51_019538 [Gossypium anomalum]|uniref:Cullin family profile domain-containing protein n=1 Tax=Gossypium anomalum TaxID=47600 RepID=A0A8J5YP91_9ROSI|nr:hypothetical protein CXB51_019538 [Gossypium anomalum]
MGCENIEFDQGWGEMEKGIEKLKRILAGEKETPFTSREYMTLYTYPQLLHFSFVEFPFSRFIIIFNHLVQFILIIFLNCNYYRTIYNMCNQKAPHDYSEQLYDKYKETLDEYINSIHPFFRKRLITIHGRRQNGLRKILSEECLRKELDKVSNYLHSSTETKLIEHVTIEGTAFVQQAEEAASNQASNTPGGHEQVKCVEVFKGFYGTKTKHRKLTWIYSLGTSHINGKFEPKPIELIVSTHQAAVLLLFNASERLSYSEIVAQLNLAHDDLIRLLHSLSCAKYKILNKEPSSKSISQSDGFKFNPNFTDKMRRITVPLPPVDERKKVIEDVDKDRPYAIDAAIVRIMKSRKVMTHQQLISETIEQLSRMFKPNIKAIKKRIEDLITRDYMERDRDNSHMFRYLA